METTVLLVRESQKEQSWEEFRFRSLWHLPLSVNVVNVAGSAKREKGVALPRTEFYLHEPRNTSHSAAVGKVVSVMMDSGRLVLRGHVCSVLPKVFWVPGNKALMVSNLETC